MKSTWIVIALAALFGFASTGCLGVASPVTGILVTGNVAWDGHANGKLGTKEGEACAKSYLTLFATGDASIKTAAANGGITNVMSVDHRTQWILIYGEYCTIVRGT